MKAFYDLLPLLVFFAAYSWGGIYWATALAIGASALQLLVGRLVKGTTERMHLVNFGLIAVFGGLTLLLRDATFIKWKPTMVNWLFSVTFAGSLVIGKQSVLERMLGPQLTLDSHIWRRLTMVWAGFFLFCGVLNLYVAFGIRLDSQDLTDSQYAQLMEITHHDAAYVRTILQLDPSTISPTELKQLVPADKTAREQAFLETVSLDYWVKFKVFGLLGLTLVFVVLQSLYLAWLCRDQTEEPPGIPP